MMEEKMLKAWISFSVRIKENRILDELSLNEMMILNILMTNDISFKDLCSSLNMLKSQVNKIITTLKEKNLVETYVPKEDKRKLMIKKGSDLSAYEREHERMLKLMKTIKEKIGEEDALKLIELLGVIPEAIEEL